MYVFCGEIRKAAIRILLLSRAVQSLSMDKLFELLNLWQCLIKHQLIMLCEKFSQKVQYFRLKILAFYIKPESPQSLFLVVNKVFIKNDVFVFLSEAENVGRFQLDSSSSRS